MEFQNFCSFLVFDLFWLVHFHVTWKVPIFAAFWQFWLILALCSSCDLSSLNCSASSWRRSTDLWIMLPGEFDQPFCFVTWRVRLIVDLCSFSCDWKVPIFAAFWQFWLILALCSSCDLNSFNFFLQVSGEFDLLWLYFHFHETWEVFHFRLQISGEFDLFMFVFDKWIFRWNTLT